MVGKKERMALDEEMQTPDHIAPSSLQKLSLQSRCNEKLWRVSRWRIACEADALNALSTELERKNRAH